MSGFADGTCYEERWLQVKKQLSALIRDYRRKDGLSAKYAVASLTADLRHLCDELDIDYGRADSLGYSQYCEENGLKQEN